MAAMTKSRELFTWNSDRQGRWRLEAAIGIDDRKSGSSPALSRRFEILPDGEGDYLIPKRVSAVRPCGEWNDDFDVLADGAVVGRIFKANATPVGPPCSRSRSA
jgi:hypothetical protein